MPDNDQAVRIAVSLPPDVGEQLEHLTASRFGKRSLAVAAAVELAALVYGDVASFGATSPEQALAQYVYARIEREAE